MTKVNIDKVISIAKQEMGTKEVPVNKTKYGKWDGLDGQPWCAMFVSWVFAQAGLTRLIDQSPKGFASCQAFEVWAGDQKLKLPGAMAQPGDIVLFDFTGAGKAQHVGIVVAGQDKVTHLITTIEGNTGPDHVGVNQANGDGVYLKYRSLSVVRCIVRPKYPN